jgi:hypothetical protein
MKILRAIFVLLYAFAPLVAVPLLSYGFGNWWLLFGILFFLHGKQRQGCGSFRVECGSGGEARECSGEMSRSSMHVALNGVSDSCK